MTRSRGRGLPGRSRNALRGLRRKSGTKSPRKKSPRKGAPKKNEYAHIVFVLVVLSVIVIVFTRDDSDRTDPTTTTTPTPVAPVAPVATTQTTPATSTTTPQTTTTSTAGPAVSTTVTTVPQEAPVVLDQVAITYMEGLVGLKETLAELVAEINAANQAWDNRAETGVSYRGTASALVDTVDKAQAFGESVRGHQVLSILRSLHEGPDGPIEQAARLAPLAEAVLAGLRIRAPEDGSARRDALADFNTAAEDFNRSADTMISHTEENAETLGLTVSPQGTTRPSTELSDEATAYVDSLAVFKETLAGLVTEMNTVNRAWDNRAETGVRYSRTTSALVEISERARAFHERIEDHPVPSPVVTLGAVPIEQAARLAPLAEAVLAGLRIRAPDDGSARRDALADFNTAAKDFNRSVDDVATYVDRNAEALGLTKDG